MINAKEAYRVSKEISDKQLEAELEQIEQLIIKATKVGRFEISSVKDVSREAKKVLTDAGYEVSEGVSGEGGVKYYTISWSSCEEAQS